MHIKSFGFRGLRKLHLNHDNQDSDFNLSAIHQYDLKAINIFVGPNGGGKSTIADLVRVVGDASVLPTIARENMKESTASGFSIHLTKDKALYALFNTPDLNKFGLLIAAVSQGRTKHFSGEINKFSAEDLPLEVQEVIAFLSAKVVYRCLHDETGVSTPDFIRALNIDSRHLNGLAAFPLANGQDAYTLPPNAGRTFLYDSPIHAIDNNIVGVSFNDDQSQTNNIPISMFPSGWRAYGGLLAWLAEQDENSICVIEEPETHMHPRLQRLMMLRISKLVQQRNLQIFITTHSSTLIDISTWPDDNVCLFEADGYQLRDLTEPAVALANLGARPSDVCQSNGVIWVEGASDRLYILRWLKLWCDKTNNMLPKENIDFSFNFYGGSMLKHFSVTPAVNLIEIFKINRNAIIVMDRDFDFTIDDRGVERAKNPDSPKAKIYNGIGNNNNSSHYCWITQGYTIESYLPNPFRHDHYRVKDGRLVAGTTVSKVEVAERFSHEINDFELSYESSSDLPIWIERIYNTIVVWNN